MELYDALKEGYTAEDLLNQFKEDLKAAEAKVKEEAAAADLDTLRTNLAEAFVPYMEAIIGEKDIMSVNDIKLAIKVMEGQIKEGFKQVGELNKIIKSIDKEYSGSDEEIIRSFIKSL